MYRIRFHGRGGHGIKTASRVLGTAFFLSGYEVQDAPVYGAERRGAPIFAYVRADKGPIHERGSIRRPDLVVVVDDTLIGIPAARVLAGLDDRTVILLNTRETAETWKDRLAFGGAVVTLPDEFDTDPALRQYVAVAAVGAAARLCGVIDRSVLDDAIRTELAGYSAEEIDRNLSAAGRAFDAMATSESIVTAGETDMTAATGGTAAWIDVPVDPASVAAPDIHAGMTSVEVRTGLWRTMRPIIDYDRCRRCWWVCSTYCPDNAISVSADNAPVIDYDHCKGCMICVAQCPPHAIGAVPEAEAAAEEEKEAAS